ncbi:MAG: cytochrome C oxidase subunit IV family protein [Conexivisphaerales archaeon]
MSEKMGRYTPFAVWAYVIIATVIESFLSINYWHADPMLINSLIFALAWSQAASIATFFMHLKYEPASLRIFVIIPLIFIISLIVGLIISIGH